MKVVRLSCRSLQLCCATFLVLAACSSDPKTSGGNGATAGSSSGVSAAGAPNNSSGGKSSVAGSNGAGSNGAGSGGAVTSASGSGAGGNAGSGTVTVSLGGSSAGGTVGSGGAPATTSGAGGGAGASVGGGACTRDFLKSTVAAYFTALAAHSTAGLPLADTVKATENSKTIMPGTDGLWKAAGMVKYNKSALDTDGCNTATEAVVPEGSTDLPVALRLKFVAQKITEIEMIVVRAGDYKVSGSDYPSKPDAIIMSDTTVMWETPVPAAMQNTAKEMNAWMSKYFKAFPAGVCNADTSCKRLENGNSPGACSLGASCQAGDPTGNVIKSHAIFSDVETGIGIGFDLFNGVDTDMHMFKMYGGKVYAVHAILGSATSTGWDDK